MSFCNPIEPDQSQPPPLNQFSQDQSCASRLRDIGGMDNNNHEQAERVTKNMPLAPFHALATIKTCRFAGRVHYLDTLRVENAHR